MKRLNNESFKAYQARRRAENRRVKQHLRGVLVWNSSNHNTYRLKKEQQNENTKV